MNWSKWWLGALLCVVSWSAVVFAQNSSWESLTSGGTAAEQRGHYAEAENDFAAALRLADKFGADDPRLATSLSNLAEVYRNRGNLAEAEPLYKRVLAMAENARGTGHPDMADSLNDLALVYLGERRVAEAEQIYKRVLEMTESAHGKEHPEVATALQNLARPYLAQTRFQEAEPLLRRALAIDEKVLGPESLEVAKILDSLAGIYAVQRHYAKAKSLFDRELAIREKVLGPDHPDVATALIHVAGIYQAQFRFSEAEPLVKRALAIREKVLGPDHPDVAAALVEVAGVYRAEEHPAETEPLVKRALAIREKALGPDHPAVAEALAFLAGTYQHQGRFAESESLFQRALTIREKALGPEHVDVAAILSDLALLYGEQARYAEAQPLLRRALDIDEKALGPQDPGLATALGNLAGIYQGEGRYAEAEPLYKRALEIREKALGPEHPEVATSVNNLAALLFNQSRLAEAEPLYERALAIDEKVLGPEHLNVASDLTNLALLYYAQGHHADAEPLLERALAINENALGPQHVTVASALDNLAQLYFDEGDYAKALDFSRRATAILRVRLVGGGSESELRDKRYVFIRHLNIANAIMESGPEQRQAMLPEAVEAMQLSRAGSVATAVAQMAARFAAGSDSLANAVRERQDEAARWHTLDTQLTAAAAKPPAERSAQAEAADRTEFEQLGTTIKQLDERLAKDFPAYAEIANPRPVTLDELQKLLGPDEAMLAYAVAPDRAFVLAVRRDGADLLEAQVGAQALRDGVAELRASLSPEGIQTPEQVLERGFPTTQAYMLYSKLFEPAEEILQGARLVYVVPDDALESLPLGVLLTTDPQGSFTDFSGYAQAPWLARKYAMAMLPSISSLKALRQFAGPSKAGEAFRGVGNPELGTPGSNRGPVLAQLFRGPLADEQALRELPSLPETEGELEAMAKSLGTDIHDLLTGDKATETAVKGGALANARVVAFATHAVVAGQIAGLAEPGLVLTPPTQPSALDDGLLTASEVAHDVKLDADWVVLSACDTAATDGTPGAEGLSGLAKAFFYAGARALLVSHWAVESHASVLLTTGAFQALAKSPEIGRAEALRRSMLAMLDDTSHPIYAHPMFWAPFVLVGEGAAGR